MDELGLKISGAIFGLGLLVFYIGAGIFAFTNRKDQSHGL